MDFELQEIISVRKNKKLFRSGDFCIKVFDEDFEKSDILNEALNQARVEQTGLNVPKVEAVTKINGKWAIVNDFIPGPTLDELFEANPEKEDEYLERFVNLQLEVQSKKCPLLTKLKDKMNRKISGSGLDATTRYELHHLLDSMPKHDKLCHGDFNPGNIVVSQSGDYVIDWSHATQGNASADVARTYLLFALEGKTKRADKYLKLFCKKSDTAMQYVQRWMPIVAASQLNKKKPEEYDFLKKWTNIVDFE